MKVQMLIVCALAIPAAYGVEKLNVKTGQWENTYTSKIEGSILPKELLDKLPPDRRAQVEQAMAARAGTAEQPRVSKTCVTEEDLKKGAFSPPDASCKVSFISSTPTHQEATVECARDGRTVNGHLVVDAPSTETIKGRMELKLADGKVIADFSGKWLGASCPEAAK